MLAKLAQKELKSGHIKNAADLLRTAEHLSFAALNKRTANKIEIDQRLEQAVTDEFEHLQDKAKDH